MNALNSEKALAFWSEKEDSPWWESKLKTSHVSLIVVHAAHENAGLDAGELVDIVVDLLHDGVVVWSSPAMSAGFDKHNPCDTLQIFAPKIRSSGVRVRRRSRGYLGLRYIQLFVIPDSKYSLSKSILTIDKYAVPQPFSLSELANSTAYANLFTSSAGNYLKHQESFASDEPAQEGVNLVHHIMGVWDDKTVSFDHGKHIETVLLVTLSVLESAKSIFQRENRLVDVLGPCYVFGDIHGNFQDLRYFMSNLVPFKHIKYSSHNFLFLGDYVDRGRHDVECLAYLCSLKVQAPNKIFLLRGNHEDRRQNCRLDESFYNHAVSLFGEQGGMQLWEKANEVFDCLPLCAVVDNKIFCTHGGIPRMPVAENGKQMRIRDFLAKVQAPLQLRTDDSDDVMRVATDLLWADPGKEDGFSVNEARGCSTTFGQKAVEEFLQVNGFDFLLRAHQFFAFGVNIAKGGKVITLFTSSNYCDNQSCAGCALVGTDNKILLLMKERSVQD
eukprot:TRINITY_DN5206_c2_g1_i3.p1 TRINITY_DN5206_c2_g1~~TRINITY_DN5206_c2_g1_i3.p1  ORF type:complete len:561 (+),score=70.77 TRINITY_DN5206_c2_g1_i3:188-1684(+)